MYIYVQYLQRERVRAKVLEARQKRFYIYDRRGVDNFRLFSM